MTSKLAGAKRLLSRGSDLGARLDGLAEATDAARGRLDDAVVQDSVDVVERASGRLKRSADHTIVALAGATGSGKSSTFNSLSGLELASVGVRRPTTSWATACVWGADGAAELLEWLEIAPRHQVMRDSMLDHGKEDDALQGVVLLDLPDHDSTEVSHHLEVDRLVALADLLVWVLDPQKYADAAVHDRYLRPLATHQEVMVVALNHIDEVPADRRSAMLADVRRLLDADGLTDVPVFATSARDGVGIDELRDEIAKRVRAKKATRQRVEADVKAAAARLRAISGDARPPSLSKERVAALEDSFAEAAGVPTVVGAVESATRLRATRATGWPVTSWLTRLRPDPLKRLHLDLGAAGDQLRGRGRTSMPAATQVQRARVESEVRAVADEVSGPLARPWADAVRRASTSRLPDLGDRLDTALSSTDLGSERIPVWAGLVRLVQWILLVTAVAGLVWLGLIFAGSYLSTRTPDSPDVAGLPVPTVMLVGGVVLGVLLSMFCRFLVAATARSRARAADHRLRAAISRVADELVVTPVRAELAAYDVVRGGLERALK